jgi:hypothetical protein
MTLSLAPLLPADACASTAAPATLETSDLGDAGAVGGVAETVGASTEGAVAATTVLVPSSLSPLAAVASVSVVG